MERRFEGIVFVDLIPTSFWTNKRFHCIDVSYAFEDTSRFFQVNNNDKDYYGLSYKCTSFINHKFN